MTEFTISGDSAQPVLLRAWDTLTIASTGLMHPPGTAVTWDLSGPEGLARIYLNGAINAWSGNAVEAVGNATADQSLLIDTAVGSSIRAQGDVLYVGSTLAGGSLSIDNRGLLKSYSGSVVDAVISGTPVDSGLSPFYLLNYATGTLQSDAGPTIRLTNTAEIPQFNGYLYINNLGSILSNGKGASAGPAIDTSGLNAAFLTQARIINWEDASIVAVDADAIRPGQYTELTNLGGVIRAGGGIVNDGIDIGQEVGISIRNDAGGEIRGAGSGIAGQQAVTIENSGEILGRLGAGIKLDTAPGWTTTIINHAGGVIRNYDEDAVDGDGIQVTGLVNLDNAGVIRTASKTAQALSIGGGDITNFGTITSFNQAVFVGEGRGALTLHNSGTIAVDTSNLPWSGSAIEIIGDYDDYIVNTGTILGSIRAGGGDDAIDNAGQVVGAVYGEGGNDVINGGGAYIYGGEGNDLLTGSAAIYGGGGDDHIIGYQSYRQVLDGGDGNDIIETPDGQHRVFGGSGYDTTIYNASGRSTALNLQRSLIDYTTGGVDVEALNIIGTDFDDIIYADADGSMDNEIYGGAGNDRLSAGGGVNRLFGGSGDDHYYIGNITTTISDESGSNDSVATRVDYDIDAGIETVSLVIAGLTVTGNVENNRIWGSDGVDTMLGGRGQDLIDGGAGNDIISGGADRDTLKGGIDNDSLSGDEGRDYLDGGAGDDWLSGGAEFDTLIGGSGADTFDFGSLTHSSAGEPDVIRDFSRVEGDRIDLRGIDAVPSSQADDSFLWIGAGGFTGQSGELRYAVAAGDARLEGDVDGDGVADFAILLRGVTNLAASDFLL